MKYFLTSFFALLIFISAKAGINASVLPPTWTKGFSISLYEGSGMLYRSNDIFLSLDSCVLTHMENGKTKKKKFMFSAQEFDQILKKNERTESR